MSTKIYIDWEDNDVLWNEEIKYWEDVYPTLVVKELS